MPGTGPVLIDGHLRKLERVLNEADGFPDLGDIPTHRFAMAGQPSISVEFQRSAYWATSRSVFFRAQHFHLDEVIGKREHRRADLFGSRRWRRSRLNITRRSRAV
ncbi:hypothetical protein [Mycobacterium sp.]|uniref:hypothetical protein n=1 Tax=Mycobacterium sp. TaxID=1785 RepID=UPI003BAFAF88